MLKSKLRKTGVYLHLRPELSKTLVIVAQLAPLCQHFFCKMCPIALRRRYHSCPVLHDFIQIIIYRRLRKHTFCRSKCLFRRRKNTGFCGRRAGKSSRKFPRRSAAAPRFFRAVSDRCKQRFTRASAAVSERFGRQFPDVFCVVFFLIIYRAGFTPNGRFRKCRCVLRRQGKNRCFRTVQNAARQGSASAPSAKRESYVSETPQTPWFCLSCVGFVFGYKM